MNDTPCLANDKTTCCGCSACHAICPVGAIEMMADEEGFEYPAIDEAACIRCQKCMDVCAFKRDMAASSGGLGTNSCTRLYGARLKDRALLEASSSGGAFTALSDYYLEAGMPIVCSSYDFQLEQQRFSVVRTREERDGARGSKYFQSAVGNVFREAESILKNEQDSTLLFVGTGCQAAGFISYSRARGFSKKVLIVDLICHGVSSPKLWREYAHQIEHDYGPIEYLNFRDKRNGWNKPTPLAVAGGREVSLRRYSGTYSSRNNIRPSCYVCPYATMCREADITMGDFWHIEERLPDQYDVMGTSLLLIHTDAGKRVFEAIMPKLDWFETNANAAAQPNLEKPVARPRTRNMFWRDYRRKGAAFVVAKYGVRTKYSRLKLGMEYLFARALGVVGLRK